MADKERQRKDSKRMAYAQMCRRKEIFPSILLEFGA